MFGYSVKITLSISLLIFLIFSLNTKLNESNNNIVDDGFQSNIKFQHVTLVVSNFKESKKFYTEILKLKDKKIPWLPENQMFISLGGNLELHVGEVEGVKINPSTFNHFALTPSDFEGFLNHLKQHGLVYGLLGSFKEYEIQTRPDGVRQTFLKDPDGYIIEINNYP